VGSPRCNGGIDAVACLGVSEGTSINESRSSCTWKFLLKERIPKGPPGLPLRKKKAKAQQGKEWIFEIVSPERPIRIRITGTVSSGMPDFGARTLSYQMGSRGKTFGSTRKESGILTKRRRPFLHVEWMNRIVWQTRLIIRLSLIPWRRTHLTLCIA